MFHLVKDSNRKLLMDKEKEEKYLEELFNPFYKQRN